MTEIELKKKIKDVFLDHMDYDHSGKAIKCDQWDELADDLVKLFAIHNVVGRSEQFCPTCGAKRTYGKWGLESCCVDAGDDC